MIRTTWLLWKLCRRLHLTTPAGSLDVRAVELRVEVEPDSSYVRRCALAAQCYDPPPRREAMHSVSYWPIRGQPCYTQRGATLAEALAKALAAPFPAEMT